MPDRELEGRLALVTGGSRGIGAAVAAELARAGAEVVVNYASNAQAAAEVVAGLETPGHAVAGDISTADGAAGAKVAVNYNSSEGPAQEVVEQITSAGSEAKAVKADVSQNDQGEAMINGLV